MVLVRFGHKNSTLFGLFIYFLSWITIILAPEVLVLLAGRLIQGVAMSIVITASELHVVESVHESVRGIIFSLLSFSRYIGCVFIFAIGASKILWRYQALISCLLTTIVPFFIILCFIPTSPRYLAGRGKLVKAKETLRYFRGSKYSITKEMANLEEVFKDNPNESKSQFIKQAKFLIQRNVMKYMLVLMIVAFGTQVNGQGILLSFIGNILKESLAEVNPFIWSLVIAMMRVFGSLIMTILSPKCSYRIIFLIFNMFSTISLIIFGIHLYLKETSTYFLPWWLGVIALCILMISTSVIVPAALLMIGEILPSNCRSLGYVITDMMFYTSYFILVYTYSYLKLILYSFGTIWLYGVSAFLIAWVPIMFLPETRGKNLEDIQMKLFKA